MPISIIDLFAGPGGLGEGFSSLINPNGKRSFKIKLSIEKDEYAHRTLELRAFFRNFPAGAAPVEYYDYLRKKISREDLLKKFPEEAEKAKNEAWCTELGGKQTTHGIICERVAQALQKEEKWILIGGPPCQAYSLVGRSRRKGENVVHFEKDEKHHLYLEYLRIIADHRPPIFVMENVKGLLSSKVRGEGMFQRIIQDLQQPSKAIYGQGWFSNQKFGPVTYKIYSIVASLPEGRELYPNEFVVCSEKFGIPQARHRVILLGIRSDLLLMPTVLSERTKTPIEKILRDLPRLRSGLSKDRDSAEAWLAAVKELQTATCLTDAKMDEAVKSELLRALSMIPKNLSRGGEFVEGSPNPEYEKEWFVDSKLEGFCNHSSRGHIRSDLHRYLYTAVFGQVHGRSPGLEQFPRKLLPAHGNVGDALNGTKFNDRFRVQIKGRPSSTITSHISKDGHYFIHYDPTQCRSLTVREAARLQTFPDNYFFEGPRTEQYRQVGNAVPPLLAREIARIVAKLLR